MSVKRFKYLTLSSTLALSFAATDALAYGMSKGKICGYSGWQHPHGYSQPSASAYGMGREDKSAKSEKDIVDTALSAGNFTTLIEAVKAAGLAETLRGKGPFTVFARSDEAFAKLPPETLGTLLQDKEKLTAILTYHVAPGSLRAAEVINRGSIETVQGESLTVMASDDGVSVDEATVTKTAILASNGVIHVIDTVVLPN